MQGQIFIESHTTSISQDWKVNFTNMFSVYLYFRSRCCLIACISPADTSREESLATLRFAYRTKWLSNTAEANIAIETDSLQLQAENSRLKGEIVDLKAKLESGWPCDNIPPPFLRAC